MICRKQAKICVVDDLSLKDLVTIYEVKPRISESRICDEDGRELSKTIVRTERSTFLSPGEPFEILSINLPFICVYVFALCRKCILDSRDYKFMFLTKEFAIAANLDAKEIQEISDEI